MIDHDIVKSIESLIEAIERLDNAVNFGNTGQYMGSREEIETARYHVSKVKSRAVQIMQVVKEART